MKLQQIFQDLSKTDIQTIEQSPGLLIFLPMLYVAWSDSVLSEDEIVSIKQRIVQQDWLTDSEKSFISDRLQPDNPPSPQQLNEWLSVIKRAAPHIPESSKKSLASLGLEITRISDQNREQWQSKNTKLALSQIEEALGVITSEALDDLLAPSQQPDIEKVQGLPEQFEVSKLSAILDGQTIEIKNRLRLRLQKEDFEKYHPQDTQQYRKSIFSWLQILSEEGYGALSYPENNGGSGNMRAYFATMEVLSYFDLSLMVKYGVQFGLFGGSILALGSEGHHRQYLKKVGNLELPGCFAMTETGHGSNVRDIETTATFDVETKEFIINTPTDSARKDYIGNAADDGQMATVFAQLLLNRQNYGVCAFLVPIRDQAGNTLNGIRIEDCGEKQGLNGVDNGRIWFSHVRIPINNLLDRFAQVTDDGQFQSPIANPSKRFFTMLGTLVGGRIGVPWAGLSAAKTGLAIAIKYAHKRRQFGAPGLPEQRIINYQAHQKRLMPLLANAYALDFTLKFLTEKYLQQQPEERREIEALAAGIKAYCTWNTSFTLQVCREACGGSGYLWENRLGELKADSEIFTTFEGDNTVLMQLVAKSRLAEFQQEFNDTKFLGLVKYIAKQATTSISELNPITIRKTSSTHLKDHDFHLAAFSYRERHLLTRAGQRLKHRIDKGMNSFQAFNECQNHLVNLAHAYVERVMLEQFVLAIKSVTDPKLNNVLSQLCQLFALNLMDKHKGWYLENGYMEGVKSKAIRKHRTELCNAIAGYSAGLVNAFNIPDKFLGPIAL
ncbi:MAG: acyl-CoA oxidase [Cyclobacteriaceae bacterium]|nr:MAG: acyl-CoA oxidase [Cyclobacteriaceae bacterium]